MITRQETTGSKETTGSEGGVIPPPLGRRRPLTARVCTSLSAQLDLRLQTSTRPVPATLLPPAKQKFRSTKKPVGNGPHRAHPVLKLSAGGGQYWHQNEKLAEFWAEWKSSWHTQGSRKFFSKVQDCQLSCSNYQVKIRTLNCWDSRDSNGWK